MNAQNTSKVLTLKEFSVLLRESGLELKLPTLRNYLRSNDIAGVKKVGRDWLVENEKVESVIKKIKSIFTTKAKFSPK